MRQMVERLPSSEEAKLRLLQDKIKIYDERARLLMPAEVGSLQDATFVVATPVVEDHNTLVMDARDETEGVAVAPVTDDATSNGTEQRIPNIQPEQHQQLTMHSPVNNRIERRIPSIRREQHLQQAMRSPVDNIRATLPSNYDNDGDMPLSHSSLFRMEKSIKRHDENQVSEIVNKANEKLAKALDLDESDSSVVNEVAQAYTDAVECYMKALNLAMEKQRKIPCRSWNDLIESIKRRLKNALIRAEELKANQTTRTTAS